MPLLAIDTSGAHVALALRTGGETKTSVTQMAKGQAEALFPLSEALLGQAGLGWRDLTRLAVCTGPGNFTGIRIGVSAVRGLALSLGVPAIGVSTFEAVAHLSPDATRVTCPTPWGAVYAADPAKSALAHIAEPEAVAPQGTARLEDTTPAARIAAIAGLAQDRPPGAQPAPLYIRGPDAAPSRDAPPDILPG
ncbi:MAG: tRNA (adenosine(37)-N6)-threonylcarbamoyltransferase complex dimerization subunit type 1 TsaB [Shimia sp.]